MAVPAFAAVLATATFADEIKQLNGDAPIVIAHRGASGYMPEHTLAGYELAVKLGADYIEPDLQLTKDGVLVAMHDDTLTRTTNVQALFPGRSSYAVSEFTLSEVKTLTVVPVGTASTTYPGFTPSFANPFSVPTFQEVIDAARSLSASAGREVGIYPEAKQADPVMEDKILQTLVANGYKGTDKVFIQSFSIDTIKSIHDKQALLGADFNLLVLSTSSTALVNYGLGNIKSFADGVGTSNHRRGHGRELHRPGPCGRPAGARLHVQPHGRGRRRGVPAFLRLGHGRCVLELHRPGGRLPRHLPRGRRARAGNVGAAAARPGRGGRSGASPSRSRLRRRLGLNPPPHAGEVRASPTEAGVRARSRASRSRCNDAWRVAPG
jgi:glycerophosphoryl diester phosphodiesterase